MYRSPNFLAVVFKKEEISQQVVTRMQDLASEFPPIFRGWYSRTLTAGGSDPLPHATPSSAFGKRPGVGTQTLVPLNFPAVLPPGCWQKIRHGNTLVRIITSNKVAITLGGVRTFCLAGSTHCTDYRSRWSYHICQLITNKTPNIFDSSCSTKRVTTQHNIHHPESYMHNIDIFSSGMLTSRLCKKNPRTVSATFY